MSRKPKKSPMIMFDCLDCPKTGYTEAYGCRDLAEGEIPNCDFCGQPLTRRPEVPTKPEPQRMDKRQALEVTLNALAILIERWNESAGDGDRGRGHESLILNIDENGAGLVGVNFISAPDIQNQFETAAHGAEWLADQITDSDWAQAIEETKEPQGEADQLELIDFETESEESDYAQAADL